MLDFQKGSIVWSIQTWSARPYTENDNSGRSFNRVKATDVYRGRLSAYWYLHLLSGVDGRVKHRTGDRQTVVFSQI